MKFSYLELKEKLETLSSDEILNYLSNFLIEDNFKNYKIDKDAPSSVIDALSYLFKEEDLFDKISKALSFDPMNKEALLIGAYILEEPIIYERFEDAIKYLDKWNSLDFYNKKELLEVFNLYVDFSASISNISYAIFLQERIMKYKDEEYLDVIKLAFLYSLLENSDKLKEIIKNYKMEDCYIYLIGIIAFLKQKREDEAEELLREMILVFPEADYIDHAWEIDEKDPKQKVFCQNLTDIYDSACSIPNFYSWCSQHKVSTSLRS